MSDPGKSILVVDDDPHLVHVLAMYLKMEGYQVITASNGEDGLKQAETNQPALIILDIMMPGMDGIEVCRRLRRSPHAEKTPVLMFSALSGDEDVERAQLAGANHLITKPFNLVGLGEIVKAFFTEGNQASSDF